MSWYACTNVNLHGRALMYVEGDASMRKFEREPGKVENALNIVQSEFY